MHQIFSTFFPTFLLWLLAYATLFIDTNDFDNRFQGSVTALLVLAALLNSITTSLPKTAYFKLIDLWFFWHTIGIFLMIIFHIVLAKVYKNNQYRVYLMERNVVQNGRKEEDVQKREGISPCLTDGATDEEPPNDNRDPCITGTCIRIKLNRVAIVILPIMSTIFYLVYFSFTIRA